MGKVKVDDVRKGVKVARVILGFLTDIKDKLPRWLRGPLQAGRDAGLWQRKQGR